MARFQPGNDGCGGGRPKGSVGGRHALLMALDSVSAEPEVRAAFIKALREELLKDPLRAFRTYIAPLLPKSVKLGGAIGIESVHELVMDLARKVNDGRSDRAGGE